MAPRMADAEVIYTDALRITPPFLRAVIADRPLYIYALNIDWSGGSAKGADKMPQAV